MTTRAPYPQRDGKDETGSVGWKLKAKYLAARNNPSTKAAPLRGKS